MCVYVYYLCMEYVCVIYDIYVYDMYSMSQCMLHMHSVAR